LLAGDSVGFPARTSICNTFINANVPLLVVGEVS